ncbi:hydrogenase 4 subunit F [Dehalobacterium formicoaceticum]|uniref:Hydrogenase 4 subunit F n=1 Tax=Dehalobacterium formicoaceticum TaxID=51515 RepID=A0ABT1Y0B5_9FIRM|nr:hydrogenase 4 subunit F [Dehalobacterium formicoaceticum]MCR6544310.1 hydrogenase 4 subunit F [Dehalobacterium formicoaceticum]
MGYMLLLIPVITVLLALVIKNRSVLHKLSLLASALMLIMAMGLTKNIILEGVINDPIWGGFFYIDALSIIVLDIVIFLSFLVSVYSVGYLEEDLRQEKIGEDQIRLYYILLYTFIFTMILALTVKNMGIMWVAIEATTLASVFLVGFYNTKESLEAAWKYIIICSVGISLAFLGIILLHLSSSGVLGEGQLLDWTALFAQAEALKSPFLRLSFLFIIVGFGTKAGLAPMHTWLPGAHSQAPSPISALLSGVLLNSAMYGIMRAVAIVNKNLAGSDFTGNLLMATGLLSIGIAAVIILSQKEYKSLLAYSSIEHMGIIAFGLGLFTPAAIFGALLHMINHSLTKSMLFFATGNILHTYHTGRIARVKGILKMLPISGTAFLLGLFAIAGTPPFSIFASEVNIIAAIFADGRYIIGGIFALLLAMVFAGIVFNMLRMFYGTGSEQEMPEMPVTRKTNPAGIGVILLLLFLILITGFYLPAELKELIYSATRIIRGE